ncbi:MAG: hypothetical protein Q8Q02_01205 [Nocardioides sp.]|nr:hypothetical protein [Nocardioides sp.]
MYPSPDLDLTIATATQRERIARHWRRRSVPSDSAAPSVSTTPVARRTPGRTVLRPGTSPA